MRVATPTTLEGVRELVRDCSEAGSPMRLSGSGHESMLGNPVDADVTVDTRGLSSMGAFDPDELVVHVGAGVTVGELGETLAAHNLRIVLPETTPQRTIGGVVASAGSGYTRLRHGPIRNHVIGIALVTGTGDVVRAGGQVVKNVTGYDISRLCVGSLGRLGIIVEVVLRVFAVRGTTALLRVDDPDAAWRRSAAPLAVLGTRDGAFALVEGSETAIATQAEQLAATGRGNDLPRSADWPWRATVRSRPSAQSELLERLPGSWRYIAQYGTGLTEVGGDDLNPDEVSGLRALVEKGSGRLVLHRVPEQLRGLVDPWGAPPPDLAIQRRIVDAFDPQGIFNPGILPGGL